MVFAAANFFITVECTTNRCTNELFADNECTIPDDSLVARYNDGGAGKIKQDAKTQIYFDHFVWINFLTSTKILTPTHQGQQNL